MNEPLFDEDYTEEDGNRASLALIVGGLAIPLLYKLLERLF